MSSIRKYALASLGVLGLAPAALAEGQTSITLPVEFTTATTELTNVVVEAAQAISPMLLKVGGAFVVLGLVIVAFRYFRRGAK